MSLLWATFVSWLLSGSIEAASSTNATGLRLFGGRMDLRDDLGTVSPVGTDNLADTKDAYPTSAKAVPISTEISVASFVPNTIGSGLNAA